jgi:hypothetical protein
MKHGVARPPRPNHLAIAVRCVKAVIRSHQRLIKLAPELFDYAAIQRQQIEDEWRRQLDSELRVALDHVYGTAQG